MYFLIAVDELLEKYNTIWDKVSADIKNKFDSKLVYNKSLLKTKIQFYCDEATSFKDKEIPKVDSYYNCLVVISLNSALKKDENYYQQVFLKKCKYIKKKLIWNIIDDLESSYDDSDDSDQSDEK